MSDLNDLFPGFDSHWIDTKAGKIFARSHGSGPPLLLLHGFPQTNVMWHRIAPALAQTFSVVLMDLRGYGWSSAPRSRSGEAYSKRAMGEDVVTVMEALGHVRFRAAGHDRGARVAYRLALDHPGRIERLALLDIMPTVEQWKVIRADAGVSAHWPWLARAEPLPENDIARGPDAYFEGLLSVWSKAKSLRAFDARAAAHYRAAWGDPTRIHAFCEDYRAGATLDLAADEADIAAKKIISAPVKIISGTAYLTQAEALLTIWRRTFAPGAVGATIDCGHFLAEEAGDATLAELLSFM